MKYSAELIGLISFAAIFGGVLVGRFVARRLPGHHLSGETQSVVTVSVAVILHFVSPRARVNDYISQQFLLSPR